MEHDGRREWVERVGARGRKASSFVASIPSEARRRALVGRLLAGCVQEGARLDTRSLDAAEGAALLAAAAYHRVVGYLRRATEGSDLLDPSAAARLWAMHEAGLERQRVVRDDLRRVRGALDGLGVPWLVVKGPVLGETVHRHPELRLYNDLDVIVPAVDFARAVTALEAAGYRVFDRNWALIRQAVAGQLHLARGPGAGIDLHWHLLYSERLRRLFHIPMDELVARSRDVVIDGVPTSTLDPSDALVHLCVHAALGGGDRLLWLKDIERAVANDPPEWDRVVRRARAWSVHLMVGAMLARSGAVIGTAVPEPVMHELVPPGWRQLLTTADRLFPAERSRGMGSVATLAVRASKGSARATAKAMAAGLATRVTHLVRTGDRARGDVRRRPDDPGSVLYRAGDEADRDAFLATVTAAGSG